MVEKIKPGRKIKPNTISNLVKSLNVLDIDVSKISERLSKGRAMKNPGDSSCCIIYFECCIIDCSKCRPDDISIYENPVNILDGFLFKLPGQTNNPEAPVYYIQEMDAHTAFRMGHTTLNIPGPAIKANIVGLAGEVFPSNTLTKHRIAPTASVITLSPARTLKAKSKKTASK